MPISLARLAGRFALLVVSASLALAQATQFSGQISASNATGTTVNGNLYGRAEDVYLNGGPQNENAAGLPDGTYYFQVTDPSGATLLSSDNAEARQLVVVNGRVAGAAEVPGAHANGTLNPANGTRGVQLWPFATTSNNGGEYKVALIMQTADTVIDSADPRVIHFKESDSKSDNFKVVASITPSVAITTITLSPSSSTITYGDSQTYTVTVSSGEGTPTGTVTITPISSGSVAGFGPITLVNGTASHTFSGLPAGTYSVRASYTPDSNLFSAGSASPATLVVNPAPLTVAADDKTKTYGDADPALTWSHVSGLVNGDTQSILTGALTRAAGENVAGAPYAITQGTLTAGANYTLTVTPGKLAITPATLTVTADAGLTKIYGSADPIFTYQSGGYQFADTAATVLTGAPARAAGENVGSYAINQGSLAANANYTIAFSGATLAITPAPLTVAADDKTKTYGDADPALTWTYVSGLANGDTQSVLTGALTRAAGENVAGAPYAITQGALTAGANYTLTVTPGKLAITPATATIVVQGYTGTYDGRVHNAVLVSATGVRNESLGDSVTLGSGFVDVPGGTVAWSFSNPNYYPQRSTVSIVLSPAPSSVLIAGGTYVYTGAGQGTTASVTGVNLSAPLAVVYTGANNVILSGLPVDVGVYTATATYAGDLNHVGSVNSATITITPADSTTTVLGGTFAYDGSAHGATASVTGIQLSASAPIVYTDSNNAVLAGAPVTPGTYTATATYAGDLNHFGSTGSAPITIVGGAITATKFYDANANGRLDAGEAVIAGWKILLTGTDNLGHAVSQAGYTAANGTVTFSGLMIGRYTVTEAKSLTGSWLATLPTASSVSLTGLDAMTGSALFGNVSLGAGGGLTLGFWSNKNGQATMGGTTSAMTANLAALTALNLRGATGANFDPATYASYNTWLLSASATNMAYMLSAQLSAMYNNVNVRPNTFGGVNGSALIYAPGATGANAAGFLPVSALIAEANAALGANGLTVTADATRTYQEALKTALDNGNNNRNFIQAAPAAFSF